MGGSRETQTTTANSSPWAPAQPLLRDTLSRAQTQGQNDALFTPTQSDNTQAGIQGLADLGSGQSNVQGYVPGFMENVRSGAGTGFNALQQTADGTMLDNQNPYLDQVLNTASQRTADRVNSQFSGAGRFGSGAHTGILSDRIGAIETDARMSNYNAERGRQLGAAQQLYGAGFQGAGLAGQLDQSAYTQNAAMLQSGQLQDQFDTSVRTAPLSATEWMSGLGTRIGGLGGEQTQTQSSDKPFDYGSFIAGNAIAAAGAMSGNPALTSQGAQQSIGTFF